MDEPVHPAPRPLSGAAETLAEVAASGLVVAGRPVLVLCSGGRDSICLLDIATRLCDPGDVSALHVNYGLRGEESDADEQLVGELCGRLDVELEVVRAAVAPRAGNLQAWARDVRYGAASRLATASGALVASAHTASDQVEGILYRLVASPSRRALLGMQPRDGILVRPLLGVSRAQTGAYCTERALRWREDRANADLSFARVRVRERVVPELRSIHAAAEQNVLAAAELLRAEGEVLDAAVSEVLGGGARSSENAEIEAARLAALPAALARLVVIRLAERAAGRLVPGAGSRTADILALAERTQGSASLDLSSDVRAEVRYGVIRMQQRSHARSAAGEQLRELSVPGEVNFGDWLITCEVRAGTAADLLGLVRTARGGGVGSDDPGLLDADALNDRLIVRGWRTGDRMSPLGMGGSTRSLADLFGARRVPRAERRSVPVLLSGEEIAWIPGVATSERFKLGPGTRRAVLLRASLRTGR